MPRSAKEANNPILLKVQSLQLSFRPAGVSLGGGGGQGPPLAPPAYAPDFIHLTVVDLGVPPDTVYIKAGFIQASGTHCHPETKVVLGKALL